ncbi:phage baseplate assembly protein V [Pseudoduganella violacea]|uniref:Phage baseplate assembly protein V n=1 Tax=Pseudoduganella violacea TaxID=1715466 RepID=A0A7W5B919_9BURK|nr:phage baseplate assembly protein V [Pseudoduganella violacea]MBB3118631.1 phage baseplate assembly protein V [Pseudoduganella violacea]
MQYLIAEMDRRLATLIQAGIVESVDHGAARCRLKVGQWVSAPLPWLSLGGGEVRHWRPPSVGEQALLVSPSGEPAAGFILPGFYSQQHQQANDQRPKVVAWKMPDGCLIEYDWENGALQVKGSKTVSIENAETVSVTSGGAVTLKCPSLLVDCPSTTFKGALSVQGNISVDGDVDASGSIMDSGGNSNHHSH